MAQTNFAALTTEQKTVWSRDLWKVARNNAFVSKFLGTGQNAMIQRITELTKSEAGARAVLTLLTDLEGDGIGGDNQMEGREEKIRAFDRVIRIDQMRNANRTTGKMADQRSIVNFREASRDQLAYWLADRIDQLAFQTLGGVTYDYRPDGTARADNTFVNLDFAADVTAPSSARYLNWEATGFEAGDVTGTIVAPTWETIVRLKAYAKDNYIRGIRSGRGEEMYHIFVTPQVMATLKLDADYMAAARHALPRSESNQLWTGTSHLLVDGLMIHEFRHVPHWDTVGDFAGEGTPTVAGCRMMMCGAQALAMADLGNPDWVEKNFDYDNQRGISIAKILGMLKPKWYSASAGSDQDFGVVCVNVAEA